MANIFTRSNDAVAKVPRNVFDLSFQNNLTMQIGALTPVFCKPVMPGDSFKIEPIFGLRFMPLVFPIQTKLTANLHFFYVRNRNLWKDWPTHISNMNGQITDSSKSVTPPYIKPSSATYDKTLGTGSLGDYLGVPSTIYGKYGQYVTKSYDITTNRDASPVESAGISTVEMISEYYDGHFLESFSSIFTPTSSSDRGIVLCQALPYSTTPYHSESVEGKGIIKLHLSVNSTRDFQEIFGGCLVLLFNNQDKLSSVEQLVSYGVEVTSDTSVDVIINGTFENVHRVAFLVTPFGKDLAYQNTPLWSNSDGYSKINLQSVSFLQQYNDGIQSVDSSQSPFTQELHLSALPFRAYESIYNAFYRDVRNNPYMLNGKPEYNRYLPSTDGGADTYPYQIRYRNWQPDFLTTAVQSPQQGFAPLVGVTMAGTMKFADEEGNVYTAQAQFADDGQTITGFSVNSPDMPQSNLRALVDMASSGISINDFRNVNALQRYLETNMRKGLRYIDWLKGHFDVDASFAELDMPEFIGGVSQPVNVSQITATSSSDMDMLGDYAGQASCMGASRDITRYCDEHGFIIGILSVTPEPNYSQLLPKHFLYEHPLDYYTPEFGHIGYQPITYKEVCPLQSYQAGDSLNDVFGYQRAWYDLIGSTDEVHGQFRTTLQDYLINRYFDSRPELGEKFLVIDPETVNKPFAYQDEVNQPILGQVYFKVTAKRPIPELGIPRLE